MSHARAAHAWGLGPLVRFRLRRLLTRLQFEIRPRNYWYESCWRWAHLRRRGAQLGWPMIAPVVRIVGPYNLLHYGAHTAFGEQVLFVLSDGRLLPYLGCWYRASIRVLDHTQVGGGALVCPGVTIGPRVAVGAHTVIHADVPPDSVVMGNPFRRVGHLARFYQRRVEDIQAHPELYQEVTFVPGSARIPWDDVPSTSVDNIPPPAECDPVTRLKNAIHDAILWVWEHLQEPDELVAAEQHARLLRKQGYRIGKHSLVHPRAMLDMRPDGTFIGDHCTIGPYAALVTHDGLGQNYTGYVRNDPVRVLDGSAIGAGALILPGVTVGPGSVIEPGAIVLKDVPPYTVVGGSPARRVATIWEWLERKEQHRAEHPDHYVPEPRAARYPLPPKPVPVASDASASAGAQPPPDSPGPPGNGEGGYGCDR